MDESDLLQELRINAIQEMMVSLNWSRERAKDLAGSWGISYSSELKPLAAIASRRIIEKIRNP